MSDDPVLKYDEVSTATSAEDAPTSPVEVKDRPPWGPWATIGWSFLLFLVIALVQLAVFIVFAIAQGANTPEKINSLVYDALVLSVATFTSTPIVIGLIVLLIYLRGCSIRNYLAWRMPGVRATVLAIVGIALFLLVADLINHQLGRPLVPEVMIDIYKTGYFIPLALTMIVAAPFGEEIFFRGFFYRGIAWSRWGPFTAILLSSIAWASMHVQYDIYAIFHIFIMGFYLGEVRRRTNSLPLTILLHAIANIVATTEMVIVVQMRG